MTGRREARLRASRGCRPGEFQTFLTPTHWSPEYGYHMDLNRIDPVTGKTAGRFKHIKLHS